MATVTLPDFRRSVMGRVALVQKRAGLQVWTEVTQANPVDTGRSRAAWNLAVGTTDLSVPAEGNYATPPLPEVGAIPPGAEVIVSNNLPYIVPLEKGHSQQAPTGFVAGAVARTLAEMDGLVRQVKALGERGGV